MVVIALELGAVDVVVVLDIQFSLCDDVLAGSLLDRPVSVVRVQQRFDCFYGFRLLEELRLRELVH